MKLVVVLANLLLASQIQASFIPGQEYKYHYNGRIASGIPGIQRQWSGLALDYKVLIQVRSDHLVVKFTNIRLDRVNKHIHSVDHYDFDYKPSVEFSEHLSKPFKVYYEEGLIQKFYVERDEPEWAVNIKKAVLSQFQVNLRQFNPLRIQRGNYLVKPDPNSKYFRVMEDGIGGECETMYTIMSAPDVETPYHNKVLNVSKTRNYENCKHRPITGYTNFLHEQCAECRPELIRSKYFNSYAQTYYKIRGDRYSHLIESAHSDSETVLTDYGRSGESIITHVNQSIVLEDVRKTFEFINPSSDSVPVYSLSYQFPQRIQFRDLVDLKKAHSIYTTHGYTADINLIGSLFQTIAQSYKRIDLEENVKNNYTIKYAELVKHFTTLSYDKINRFYNLYVDYIYEKSTPEEKAKFNLFLNVLNDVGTNPSYMYVRHLIHTDRITPAHAAAYFTKIASTLKEPTEVLLDDLFRLCSHEQVNKHQNVQRACYLAFSSLVHEHCVNRDSQNLLSSVYGKTCTPEVTEKYVNYLEQQYEHSRTLGNKTFFLLALGTAGAKKTITHLQPIIQGKTGEPLHIRQSASWALYRMAKLNPEEVLAVVSPVLFNTTEDHEIRIIAFNIMVETRPSLYHYYDIVKIMRYDSNIHVQNYIYTSLQYFSNSTHPCHVEIADKAKLAFEVLKASNFTPVYSPNYSFRYVNGGYSPKYKYGGYTSVSYVANNVSYIPRAAHVTFEDFYSGRSVKSLEFGFRTQGLDKIIDKIFGPEGIFYKSESVLDILSRKPRSIDNIRKELKEIEDALALTPREYESVVGHMYIYRYGHILSQFSFDKTTFQDFFSQNTFPVTDIFALLKRGIKYNTQMYMLALDVLVQVPSELGLPLSLHVQLPTQTSLNIKDAKFQVAPAVFAKDRGFKAPKSVEITANGKLSTDTTLLVTLSILSPFEKLQYGTGYESRTLTTLPLKGSVKYDLPTSKFSYEYEPFHETVYRTTFEPFTYIDSYANLIAVREEKSYSPIGIHESRHESQSEYGQDYLGVGLKVQSRYYGYFHDRASYAAFFQDHDWRSIIYYFSTNPHYRPYQFQVKITPATTRQTQKFVGSLQLKYHHLASDVSYSPVHAERDSEFDAYSRAQKSRRPQTISVVANVKTVGSFERKLDAEFVYQWTYDNLYHRYGLYAKRTPFTTDDSRTKYCVNALVQVPQREWKKIITLRTDDIDTKVVTKVHVGWGSDCTSDKTIKVTISNDRTEEQLRYIKQIPQFRSHYKAHTYPYYEAYPHPVELGYNPYADLYYRCVHQQSNGFIMNYECLKYVQRTTEARKYDVKIHYKNIPEYFSNVTMKLHAIYNHRVFPHIDFYFNSGLNRPEGLITIKANFSALYPVYDAEIKFPQGNLHYNRVYQTYYYPFASIYPYAVTHGYYQHYFTNFKHLTYSACAFDKYVQTFSNTTYEAPLTDCYHVIAKDCSESEEYTVMIAKSTTNPKHKNLRVLLKERSIEMIPFGGAIKVRVDGKAVPVKQSEPYFQFRQVGSSRITDFVIRVVDELYFIDVPHTGLYVQFDGSNGVVFLSNYYRGKQCGMCGNMNGRTDYTQYSGPRQCFYPDTTAFTYSYAVKTSQCTVPKFQKSIICDVNPERNTFPDEVCTPLRNRIIYGDDFEGQVCFSTKPLPECSRRCIPTRILTKSVKFHCLRSRDQYAQQLISLREKRVLYELDNKKQDKIADVEYPESCVPPSPIII